MHASFDPAAMENHLYRWSFHMQNGSWSSQYSLESLEHCLYKKNEWKQPTCPLIRDQKNKGQNTQVKKKVRMPCTYTERNDWKWLMTKDRTVFVLSFSVGQSGGRGTENGGRDREEREGKAENLTNACRDNREDRHGSCPPPWGWERGTQPRLYMGRAPWVSSHQDPEMSVSFMLFCTGYAFVSLS